MKFLRSRGSGVPSSSSSATTANPNSAAEGEAPISRAFGSSVTMNVEEEEEEVVDDEERFSKHDNDDGGIGIGGKRGLRQRTWNERAHVTARWLLAPIDGVTLGLFRIAFAYVLFLQGRKWNDLADGMYRSHGFLLPYPMFGWVPPPPVWLGHVEQLAMSLLPIAVALGYHTRTACALLFLCFTHLFIICESNHNNHYILFCYALAMAPFTRMDANLSVRVWGAKWGEGTLVGGDNGAALGGR